MAGPGQAACSPGTPPTQAAEQLSRTASTDSLCSNASTLSRLGPPPPQPPPKPPPPQRLPATAAHHHNAAMVPPTAACRHLTASPIGAAGTSYLPAQHPAAALHQAVGAAPRPAPAPAAFTDARAPMSSEQQIAADATLARQLQQQLAFSQQAATQLASAKDEALARQLQQQLVWGDQARDDPGPGGGSPARAARDQRHTGGSPSCSTLASPSAAGTTTAAAAAAAAADPLRTALCRASSSSSGASDGGVGDSGHARRLNLFRSLVARQTVTLATDAPWVYFDCGPRDRSAPPLIFLHGASGTAQSFFQQMLTLSAKGYRCVSVQPPPYFSHAAWLHGFEAFAAHLKVRSRTCHLYGDGLGCFLALLYAQRHPRRVASLVLCNGYCSTVSLGFGERLLGGAWK